jgi:hypothetical protein
MSVALERPFPTDFESAFHPLVPGDFSNNYEANVLIADLAARGFVVARGIHRPQSENLAAIAHDSKVVEYCPNDGQTRFGDEEMQGSWVRKNTGRAAIGIYYVDSEDAIDVDDLPDISIDDVMQVAHGWGGEEKNQHIPGADITTAYRVSSYGRELAHNSRTGENDRFSLGYPLGVLVIENLIEYHGVPREVISLETWESNESAMRLYERLGFEEVPGVERIPGVRPTLKPVGTVINGNVVRFRRDEETGLDLPEREVVDRRVFQVLTA